MNQTFVAHLPPAHGRALPIVAPLGRAAGTALRSARGSAAPAALEYLVSFRRPVSA